MQSNDLYRFKRLLKENGYFTTSPRKHIFELLQLHPTLTMKGLIALSKQHDQATIYRTIDLFEKLGIIHRLRLGWHTKIELSDSFQHHHHHLTCTFCGKVIILKEDAIIEKQIKDMALLKNFLPADHELEIRGKCKSCQLA